MEPSFRAAWDDHRPYLLAIAAGMLGRPSDAEDVVQEAFARLAAAPPGSVEDVRGWLIVVTRRLCLDRLRLADTRRTVPTPEPPEGPGGVDPADRLTLDDEVRRALSVVIDRLSPAERTSFVLHDVFGFPFGAVAEMVGRTPTACRQLARRARLSIRSRPAEPVAAGPRSPAAAESAELAARFIAACQGGDLGRLVDLLDPGVAGLAHVIGWDPLPPVQGAGQVAARILHFFGPTAGVTLEPFALEGHPAVVARRGGEVAAVLRLDYHAGRIIHLHAIARPFPGPTVT